MKESRDKGGGGGGGGGKRSMSVRVRKPRNADSRASASPGPSPSRSLSCDTNVEDSRGTERFLLETTGMASWWAFVSTWMCMPQSRSALRCVWDTVVSNQADAESSR